MSSGEIAKVPALQVISGDASAEEIAAVVAVLAAVGGGEPASPPAPSRWTGRAGGGWKASGLPRS